MNILTNINKIKKREVILIAIGALLLIILISFVFYALRFLIIKTNIALENEKNDENKLPRINFDGLKKIGIMK